MPDCLFFHTQIFTLFNYDFVKRIPSVISLDATPHQFKGIASSYDSNPATGVLGKIKHEWYRGVFRHAVGLVAISKWVRDSLIADYGVEPDKIMVIPYSVDLEQWKMPDRRNRTDKRIKLLFVGGDFKRKGGELLLEAYRKELSELCELDIVTRDEVLAPETFVRIHRDMKPGSPELRRLFTDADIFVLPTFGDAHSIVGVEAMAAGLPVISTRVGAIPEVVEHGVTGYLLGDNTPAAISSYVLDLVKARNKRLEMGYAGRQRAQDIFSVQENYDRLLVYLKRVASCDLDAEVS